MSCTRHVVLAAALASFAILDLAHAQPGPLTLDEVLASLPQHPVTAAARSGVDRAEGQLLAAEGAFDPRLRARSELYPVGYYDRSLLDTELRVPVRAQGAQLFAGWRQGLGDFPQYDEKLRTERRGEVRAGIEVPLLRDRAIDRARAEADKAELADDLARAELAQRSLELARDATIAYWRWVAAGHRVEVRKRQLAIAQQRDAGLRRTIEQGNAAPIEGTDNARAIATREAMVIGAERDALRTARELSLYLRDTRGLPVIPTLARLPPLPAVPEDAPAAQAPVRLPILDVLGFRLEANAIDLALAENQRLPGISASAFAVRGLGPPDPTLPDRRETAVGIGLAFDLPIPQRAARGAAAMALADRTRLREEQRLIADRIAADLDVTEADLVAARSRVRVLGRQAELAEQLAEAERTRFANGDSTLLVVNLREDTAADAAALRVDGIAEYLEATARHEVARGRAPQ